MEALTGRDILHKLLEEGDLDYQIYAVNLITDETMEIPHMNIYDDVLELKIVPPMTGGYAKLEEQIRLREKTKNTLEAIRHNIMEKKMYGVYEITRDLSEIIDALEK
jgi:hypothetical protein